MTTANQVIALLKHHIRGDEQKFLTVAAQIAAREADQGHTRVAEEIRNLIDQARTKQGGLAPLIQQKGDLVNLLSGRYSDKRLENMILPRNLYERLKRIVTEQENSDLLKQHNLQPRRKLLLVGAPGTGKSMTASAIAGELNLPIFTVLYDGLFTQFMGETAVKLKLIFEAISSTRGVYFFDEFDALGSQRSNSNDVGEIRRVLNSFLQFLENDESDSLIITATNHPDLLDKALYRRFDDVIQYKLPSPGDTKELIQSRFDAFQLDWKPSDGFLEGSTGLSQAEIVQACIGAAKDAVLAGKTAVLQEELIASITERISMTDL